MAWMFYRVGSDGVMVEKGRGGVLCFAPHAMAVYDGVRQGREWCVCDLR